MAEDTIAEDSIATEATAPEANAGQDDNLPVTRTLGIERWIQFAYIAFALALFWFFDHLIVAIWEVFADSDATIASAGAAILALVTSLTGYRNPKAAKFSREVAEELSRVTWPTREETRAQTVIVLVVSAIAAVIFGVYDFTWSKLSDLIYQL